MEIFDERTPLNVVEFFRSLCKMKYLGIVKIYFITWPVQNVTRATTFFELVHN